MVVCGPACILGENNDTLHVEVLQPMLCLVEVRQSKRKYMHVAENCRAMTRRHALPTLRRSQNRSEQAFASSLLGWSEKHVSDAQLAKATTPLCRRSSSVEKTRLEKSRKRSRLLNYFPLAHSPGLNYCSTTCPVYSVRAMSTLGRYSWHLARMPWIGFDLNASTRAAFGSADRSGSAFCSSR